MEFSLPIFLVVVGLGVLQLAVGVVFGRCLPLGGRRNASDVRRQLEAVGRLAGGIRQLVGGVADDVDRHRTQIGEVHRQLADPPSREPQELNHFVVGSLARLMELNEGLQTRLTAAEAQLQRQTEQIESHLSEARTDPLTRLPNRRAFDDELVRRIAEFQRRLTPFSLAILDVDHFKRLNDRYGHLAGDHVLRRLGEALHTAAGRRELVARIGGEEFAVVLPGKSASEACRAAEVVRAAIAAEDFQFDENELRTTVSLGLATVESGDDPTSIIRRADEALYAAKRNGRDCGYLHNGQSCERIQPETPSEVALHEICDELRRRVADVAANRQPVETA